MDSTNLSAVKSREIRAAISRVKKKYKSNSYAQESPMAAGSASSSAAKGRKKRPSQALEEHGLEGGPGADETGDTAIPKSKKARTTKHESRAQANPEFDDQFFELPGTRRVTINSFKGNTLIHIREYYVDQNGDKKPGKKGISLTPTQYSAFMTLLPDIEAALVARGETVERPRYSEAVTAGIAEGGDNTHDGNEAAVKDEEEDEEQTEVKKGKDKKPQGKENFEATSDEDE